VRKPEPDDFVGFYSNLFTDTRIVRTLHQRSHWRIVKVEMLEALVYTLPTFGQTVLSMEFYVFDQQSPSSSPFDQAMSLLSMCRSLTSLFLSFNTSSFTSDLDVLSQSLPSLETFQIRGILNLMSGSVALKNLREMRIEGTPIEHATTKAPNLLPVHSALTLQTLSLYTWPLFKGLYSYSALDCFVNLASLDIRPLNLHLCKCLMQYPGRLTTFKTDTDAISEKTSSEALTTIAQALSSPCLQNLKTFRFFLSFANLRYIYPDMLEPIIDTITRITTIENLGLGMSLDLHWHVYFCRMINLKRLSWRTEEHFNMCPSFASLGIDMKEDVPFRMLYENPEKMAKIVFSKALEKLPVMPKLNFDVESYYGEDEYGFSKDWSQCSDEDELDNDDI